MMKSLLSPDFSWPIVVIFGIWYDSSEACLPANLTYFRWVRQDVARGNHDTTFIIFEILIYVYSLCHFRVGWLVGQFHNLRWIEHLFMARSRDCFVILSASSDIE